MSQSREKAMTYFWSMKTCFTGFGAVLLIISAFLAYSEYKIYSDLSHTYLDHVDVRENAATERVTSLGHVDRAQSRNGTVRTPSPEGKYYSHIPELSNLALSRNVLKISNVNRIRKREIKGRSGYKPVMLRSMIKTPALQTNRLLYKLQKSTLLNGTSSKDSCVIRILQMCHQRICINKVSDAGLRWNSFTCEFSNCRIETKVGNKLADFYKSDIVIFHPDLRNWTTLIKGRIPGQLWVFHSKEAPNHGPDSPPRPEFGNPFNISISYNSDADIASPYNYVDTDYAEKNPMVLRKKKLISWAASNCNKTSWKRMQFVQELQKHLKIDIYGRCGSLECPRFDDGCWEVLKQYKFHLALENSQCREYITEKFWLNCLVAGVVPVVYGVPKADYERLAPPHSFIHLDDFKTVQEFADYIQLLDGNDELYLEYFSWRRLGGVRNGAPSILANKVQSAGDLCYTIKTLLVKSLHPEKYSWQDRNPVFYDWWYGMCPKGIEKKRVMDIDV